MSVFRPACALLPGAMGKQRSKDRAYISASEWATEWGGRKDRGALPFSRLPFHCCALTFTPFGAPLVVAWLWRA